MSLVRFVFSSKRRCLTAAPLVQVTTLILVICTTALHLYLVAHKFHLGFRHAIATSQGIGSAIVFCLAMLVTWPVTALLAYHLRVSRVPAAFA